MKNPLFDIFLKRAENGTNGIHIVSAPTGMGKTYQATEAIATLLWREYKRKILFVANKINTAYEPFEDLKKRGIKDIAFLKSEADEIADFLKDFSKYREDIGDKPDILEELESTKTFFKHDLYKTNDFQGVVKERIGKIKRVVKNTLLPQDFNRMKKEAKKRLLEKILRENEKWLKALFPSLYTDRYRAIFLTMDKFMYGYFSFEGRKNFYEWKDALIFIDEFDATKKRILSFLSDRVVSDDLVGDFRQLYAAIYNNKAPNDEKSSEIYDRNSMYLAKIHKTFRLDRPLHNESNLKQKDLLLRDGGVIVSAKDAGLSILFDDAREKNIIVKGEGEVSLSHLRNVLAYQVYKGIPKFFDFMIWLYYRKKHEKITFEDAVSTIFNRFAVPKEQRKRLRDAVDTLKLFPKNEFHKKSLVDFFDRGFSIFFLKDDDSHKEDTHIVYRALPVTPESMISYVAKNNILIGFSATAELDALLGNYNLTYLRRKLGDKMTTLDEEERESIAKFLKDGEISKKPLYEIAFTPQIGVKGNKERWMRILCESAPVSERINARYVTENFVQSLYDIDQERSLALAYALCKYYRLYERGETRSFIYFGNKLYQKDDGMVKSALRIASFLLRSEDRDASAVKEELESLLYVGVSAKAYGDFKEREAFFLMTTYESLMEGVNLQHRFDEKLLKEGAIICCANRDEDEVPLLKDIDGIFLEKKTFFVDSQGENLMTNLYNYLAVYNAYTSYRFKEVYENIQKESYQAHLAKLKEKKAKDIASIYRKKREENNRNVVQGFYRKYLYDNFAQEAVRLIIQTLGRLHRTPYKNRRIRIFVDEYYKEFLEHFGYSEKFAQLSFIDIFEELVESAKEGGGYKNESFSADSFTMKVAVSDKAARKEIGELLESIFDGEAGEKSYAIEDWKKLREIVLRHPVIDELPKEWQIPLKLYVEAPRKMNGYSFERSMQEGIVSRASTDKKLSFVVDDSILEPLMKIEPLRRHFEEKKYAVKWEKGRFLPSPALFNDIYKGALGEAAGIWFFEKLCEIELEELEEEIFERFDMKYKEVSFDFKYFSQDTLKKDYILEGLTDKVTEKMERYGIKKCIVANIHSPDSKGVLYYDEKGKRVRNIKEAKIVAIPSLFDFEKRAPNLDLIAKIEDLKEWMES